MSYGGTNGSSRISTAADSALSSPVTGDVLTYDGSTQKWKNSPQTSGSASSTGQTVRADAVPSGSGLSNVTANGTTDDSAVLQAQLNYIKSTWGGGTLVLPSAKTMALTSGITVPAAVRIVGDRTASLFYKQTTGAAVTVNDGSVTPLIGIKIIGQGASGTSIGLDVSGARNEFRNLEIRYFNKGINLVNSDTYINTFEQCLIGNCATCVWGDIAHISSDFNPVSNSGERTVFSNCLFDNSSQAVFYSAPGSSLFFTNTSIDYVGLFGTFSDVTVGFANCHLEANAGTLASNSTRFMFDLKYDTHVTLTNTAIILGGTPGWMMVKPGTSSAYGNGYLHLQSTYVYFTDIPTSTNRNMMSESNYTVASGATTFTTYAPFSSRWSSTTVQFVFKAGIAVPAGIIPTITGFSDTTGKLDVSFSAAIPSGGAVLLINYGR